MSDSDSDLLTNNVFTFQNESTMINARGPNINVSTVTGPSFRDRVMSSTMQLPRNFGRSRYAESHYDQRSMYRRETSPMSVASACDMRQRNFNNSFYPRGMSSQRSVFNGRSGSPMSVRSIDSSASVSATSIAMAFKNVNFNKYDLRIIKEAYNKFMKHRVRKRIEKRRNLRLFLKGKRRKSGYDSGELGSDSSISSDDRSHISSYKENYTCRSTKTDILTDFRRSIKESNMYKDCTENFRQNTFRNKFAPISNKPNSASFRNVTESSQTMNRENYSRNNAPICQKDRFNKNGFLLPSQRFNKSVASTVIHEDSIVSNNITQNKNQRRNVETDSDHEEIFSKQITNQRKRSIDTQENVYVPSSKRTKVASPCKNSAEVLKTRTEATVNKDDFVFAKPVMPVRKVKERLISKSRAPITEITEQLEPPGLSTKNNTKPPKEIPTKDNHTKVNEIEKQSKDEHNETQTTTDVSMRPSFIKRKLFTQNLDVAENKNISSNESSPQGSIYGAIQKEKHKARKLVSSQSCMSHDIQDDSNLLDLIHKIVPPNSMNITNQTNKTEVQSNKNKSNETDKWDVTSIISNKVDDNISDTFTDDEIFNNSNNTVKSPVKLTDNKHTSDKTLQTDGGDKIKKGIKSFWDTDSDSEIECQIKKKYLNPSHKQAVVNLSINNGLSSVFKKPLNKPNLSITQNNANTTIQRTNIFKIKSHRAPRLKEIPESDSIKSYFQTQKPQTNLNNTSIVYESPIKNKKPAEKTKKNPDKIVQEKKSQNKTTKDGMNQQIQNKNKADTNQKATQSKENINNKKPSKENVNNKKPTKEPKKTPKKQDKKTPEKKVSNKTKTVNNKSITEIKSTEKATKVQSNTKRKDVIETPTTNKNAKTKGKKSPKVKDSNKTKTLVNSSLDCTLETINKTGRALRSCRMSKNSTHNNSSIVNLTLNTSINKSLRSRNINITVNQNFDKKRQNARNIERFFR